MTAKKKPTKTKEAEQKQEIEKVKEKVDAQTPKASHVEIRKGDVADMLREAILEIRERIEHNELISGIQRKPWKVEL